MKNTYRKISLIGFTGASMLAACISMSAAAEDRYVTDTIYIPLRADKDNSANIVKNGLVTGTRLKFLREEEDANKNKWSQVLTPDGVEGWVRSQNLTTEPTAAMKLDLISQGPTDLVELQKQNVSLKSELATTKTAYETLLKETEEMRKTNNSDINMSQENQAMHERNQLLQTDVDVLKAENDQLHKNDNYHQRMYGGALVLGGVLLSFILQLIGKRKRRSEWN